MGVAKYQGVEKIKKLITNIVGRHVDVLLNDRFLNILSTKENINLQTLGFEGENIEQYTAIISQIKIAGERLGTVIYMLVWTSV